MKLNKNIVTGVGGGVLAVAVVVLISVSSAKKREAAKHEMETKMAQQSAPRPVRFERVRAMPAGKERRYPGIVKASDETALSFRVGGPLIEVNVKLGERVQKGDLLMQVDPRDFEDRIQSLEAQLAGAVAVQQNAGQDYSRIAGLFKEKVVPQSDYDHAVSALDSASATVKNIDAQLAIARHALKDTSLRAPYDGTVTKQLVENHEMVKAGQMVLQFHNIQWLEVAVNVPENEVARHPMQGGVAVEVSFPSIPGEKFEAQLKEWSTAADALTRTYEVTFGFQAPDNCRILPGMSAAITLADDPALDPVLTVPVSALSPVVDGGSALWIYDEASGHAARRKVGVGKLVGAARMVVTEGLSEGEQVVVSGSRLIHGNLALKNVEK
ncbi:MAG: efflux RND transporter periplasmic adaptor subunit [Kiritimatiellales bacterium]|nr:efflux RND transporter periplasmic adaptor subunit [Kiritimatiellales bacterium]